MALLHGDTPGGVWEVWKGYSHSAVALRPTPEALVVQPLVQPPHRRGRLDAEVSSVPRPRTIQINSGWRIALLKSAVDLLKEEYFDR